MLKLQRVVRVASGAVSCLVLLLPTSIKGQSAEAVKTELYAIPTATFTDEQFLTGAKNGKADVIVGELRLPRGGTERLPAVLVLHGSGGFTAQEEHWARLVNGLGA